MAFFKQLFASKNKPYIPSLEKIEDLTVNLSGASLSMRMPAQKMMGLKGFWCGNALNIYDRDSYYEIPCELEGVATGFSEITVLNRSIGLYGKPWESEVLADLNVVCSVYRVDGLPEPKSCLNPADFERVIERFVYFDSGPGNLRIIENSSVAPFNWQVRNIADTEWIEFDCRKNHAVYPNDTPEQLDRHYRTYLMTPLDNEYFLFVKCIRNGFMPSALSNQQLDKLQNTIIDSFKLTLSSDARKAQAAITQTGAFKPYSPTRKPFEWTYYDARRGNTFIGEPEWVISALGSPAPDYKISG